MFPNYLIVGMAKCGTSSLAKYMEQHPEIYVTPQKEPRYLTGSLMKTKLGGPKDEKVEDWYIKDYEEYIKQYDGVTGEKAIGEASADTLYFYKSTIPLIKEKFGDPKIIIILRDPVKRAFSAYQHLVRDEREYLSFEEALKKEEERIEKNYELIYHYTHVSMYYEPVKAFMDNFSQVKVIFNEDLSKNTAITLKEVFGFLGVDTNVNIDTDVRYNKSGVPKNKLLHNLLSTENIVRKIARPIVRTIMPTKETRSKFTKNMVNKNLQQLSIPTGEKEKLKQLFKEDVAKLEGLLGKKIDFWLN